MAKINVNTSPLSDLVAEFNRITGQNLKRFADRKSAIRRLQEVMPKQKASSKAGGKNHLVTKLFSTIDEAIKNNHLKGAANKKAVVKIGGGYRVVCFMTVRNKGLEVVATV